MGYPARPQLWALSLSGPGNQYCGMKEALIFADTLEMDFVIPVFIPHVTTRANSRRFYSFSDIFDEPFFIEKCHAHLGIRALPFSEAATTLNDPRKTTGVLIRKDDKSIQQAQRYFDVYREALGFETEFDQLARSRTARGQMRSRQEILDWYQIFKEGSDRSLLIVGIFNNLKLGGANRQSDRPACVINHCLNCQPNPSFDEVYQRVNRTFRFNKKIRDLGDRFIEKQYGDRAFLGFHLRVCDLPRNRTFAECYSGYSQDQVRSALEAFCADHGIDPRDIFLATPPQLFSSVSDLTHFLPGKVPTYANPDVDPHLSSLVEQYICTRAAVFLRSYTNIPDLPRKDHSRSSWAELVEGMRAVNGLEQNFTVDEKITASAGLDRPAVRP